MNWQENGQEFTIMDKQIDKLINHIRDLENRLGEVDNNLRYIKVVQALKHSLDKLDDTSVS